MIRGNHFSSVTGTGIVISSWTPQYTITTDGSGYIRQGLRGGYFVIDRTLTGTGFAGSENTDWENIETIIVPAIVTATVENAAPANVVLTMKTDIDPVNFDITSFALAGKTISSYTIVDNVITLTITGAYDYGDSISLNYTKPTINFVKGLDQRGYLLSFTGQVVTNNIANPINANAPSGVTLTLISGGVKIDWTDNNGGTIPTEIWGQSDGGSYNLLYTIAAGTYTKSESIAPVVMRYYKLRVKDANHLSVYSDIASITMLGDEKVTNGTFASDVAGWTNVGQATRERETIIFSNGGMKGIVTTGGIWTADSDIRQTVAGLTIGKTYRLIADLYSPSGNYGNNRSIIYIDAYTGLKITNTTKGATETRTGNFTASATSHLVICSILNYGVSYGASTDYFYADNISVREILNP